MFDYAPSLQRWYTKIFRVVAKFFHETLRLSPNQVSIMAFILSLVGIVFIVLGSIHIAIAITLVAYLLDAVDGTIARTYNLKTKRGYLFETVFDGLHELIVYPALAYAGYVDWYIVIGLTPFTLFWRTYKHFHPTVFDPGFRRTSVVFGYLIGFNFMALNTLLWQVFGTVVTPLALVGKWFEQRTKKEAQS